VFDKKEKVLTRLVGEDCYAGVMEILTTTVLAIAAVASGKEQIPAQENATAWLY